MNLDWSAWHNGNVERIIVSHGFVSYRLVAPDVEGSRLSVSLGCSRDTTDESLTALRKSLDFLVGGTVAIHTNGRV